MDVTLKHSDLKYNYCIADLYRIAVIFTVLACYLLWPNLFLDNVTYKTENNTGKVWYGNGSVVLFVKSKLYAVNKTPKQWWRTSQNGNEGHQQNTGWLMKKRALVKLVSQISSF